MAKSGSNKTIKDFNFILQVTRIKIFSKQLQKNRMYSLNTFLSYVVAWYSGYPYCKTPFRKPEFKYCASSNPAIGVLEIFNDGNV